MDLKSAERLARQRVKDLWPELAAVQPTVAPRTRRPATAAQLSKLADAPAARSAPEPEEVIFTFAGELRTPEGDALPRVARVTVRAGSGVIRAMISR